MNSKLYKGDSVGRYRLVIEDDVWWLHDQKTDKYYNQIHDFVAILNFQDERILELSWKLNEERRLHQLDALYRIMHLED